MGNKDQISIINGNDLINNPGQVIEEIQDFLNVDKFITKDNFVYDKKQGFYCIKTNENPKKFCVGDHSKHGSSRSLKKRDQKTVSFDEIANKWVDKESGDMGKETI